MSGDLCCNVEISHETAGYLRTKNVRLHVVGTAGGAWMTPDEARRLAALLVQHADRADGKQP